MNTKPERRPMTEKVLGSKIFDLAISATEDVDFHHPLLKAVKRFDGKKVSRWITKAAGKALAPKFAVEFVKGDNWSSPKIRIDRARAFFSFGRTGEFNYADFEATVLTDLADRKKSNEAIFKSVEEGDCYELAEAINHANEVVRKLAEKVEACGFGSKLRHKLNIPS